MTDEFIKTTRKMEEIMSEFDINMIAGEEDFPDYLENKIKPWAKDVLEEGYFESCDGKKIHYARAIHPDEKASLVISHGFCEFIPKYLEVIYYFYQMGYSVFMLEYRGHGFSQRGCKALENELDKVYVKNYQEYVEDLHGFMDQVVTKESLTRKYILFAHSMGGCIATLFLQQYPNYFKKAILSTPMLEMDYKDKSVFTVNMLFILSKILRWGKKYLPGQKGFDNIYKYEGSSSMSETRYRYVFEMRQSEPHYTTYSGTYAWARASAKATKKLQKNASKVRIPVLLFQAGLDTMVKSGGQDKFAENAVNVKMVRYDASKHEIFNASEEIRRDYYLKIYEFLSDL
ncbi:MAG: alpha/beta hydrolase [Lachnospiraceae bacterium]|nr:alpha/beta hydrolase [Lachnospiraceae bacterium]